jgi:histidinol phosphatase-like PHP family hydrolase
MVLAAAELGHEYLAITDHSPRLTVAHGLSAARLRAQLGQIAELRARPGPFRVLSGIEVDIRDDGSLDQDDALLEVAIAAGCVFSVDSDAHAPGQLDWQVSGCARAAAHGLSADRVVDTWPVEQLLDWTRNRLT